MNIDNSNFNPSAHWEQGAAAQLYSATDEVIKCLTKDQMESAGFAIDPKLDTLLGKGLRVTVPEGEIKAWVRIAKLIEFARLAQRINSLTPNVNNSFARAVKSYTACVPTTTNVIGLVQEIFEADYYPSLENLTDGFKNTTGLISQVWSYLKPKCFGETTPAANALKLQDHWKNTLDDVTKLFLAQNAPPVEPEPTMPLIPEVVVVPDPIEPVSTEEPKDVTIKSVESVIPEKVVKKGVTMLIRTFINSFEIKVRAWKDASQELALQAITSIREKISSATDEKQLQKDIIASLDTLIGEVKEASEADTIKNCIKNLRSIPI